MNISAKIKYLRKARDLTQEELASYLSVTAQAVSKWESGTGLPDISLIPTIASFFEVSTDELFGMEKLKSEQRLREAYVKTQALMREGDVQGAIAEFEAALKLFPANTGLLSGLAMVLAEYSADSADLLRAVELTERALSGKISDKGRSTAKAALVFIYAKAGETEKSRTAALNLPHFWESREFLVPETLSDVERSAYLREKLPIILNVLATRVSVVRSAAENLRDIFVAPEPAMSPESALSVIAEFFRYSSPK
jgi:transcriptional regulator with XRE-family HTH domain